MSAPQHIQKHNLRLKQGTYNTYRCSTCHEDKRYNAYAKCATNKTRDGLQFVCRECTTKYDQEHYKKVSVKIRSYQLQKKYGITPTQYDELYEKQNGKCAICGMYKSSWQGRTRGTLRTECLAVDHDHNTNRVRGLLCSKCNMAVGLFNDDPELMLCAIEYLK